MSIRHSEPAISGWKDMLPEGLDYRKAIYHVLNVSIFELDLLHGAYSLLEFEDGTVITTDDIYGIW